MAWPKTVSAKPASGVMRRRALRVPTPVDALCTGVRMTGAYRGAGGAKDGAVAVRGDATGRTGREAGKGDNAGDVAMGSGPRKSLYCRAPYRRSWPGDKDLSSFSIRPLPSRERGGLKRNNRARVVPLSCRRFDRKGTCRHCRLTALCPTPNLGREVSARRLA